MYNITLDLDPVPRIRIQNTLEKCIRYLDIGPRQEQVPHHHLLAHLDSQQQRRQLVRICRLVGHHHVNSNKKPGLWIRIRINFPSWNRVWIRFHYADSDPQIECRTEKGLKSYHFYWCFFNPSCNVLHFLFLS